MHYMLRRAIHNILTMSYAVSLNGGIKHVPTHYPQALASR